MINIEKIKIERFRSILKKLEIENDTSFNLISICGQNNVGKTNTLRAINLFFNPELYDVSLDRPLLKEYQRGGSIDPKITLTFFDSRNSICYEISRDLKDYIIGKKGLSGIKYEKNTQKQRKKININEKEILSILESIEFRYIESINVDIPKFIEELTENIIDVEYDKSRLSNTKKELYKAYKEYTNGLQGILDTFSDEISKTFNNFRTNWNVKFNIPSNIETFRDLISNDVELHIDDRGGFNTEQKGSGLQRLAVILLNFEILKRIRNKNYIVCIDEPDIYLHEGLQKKLKDFFKDNSKKIQIFYTTHSKIFIDSYSLKNVHFLEVEIYPKKVVRKNKTIDVVETKYVDLNTDDGYDKICENLGIERNDYEILKSKNILVEGGCDKKYLEELGNYFSLEVPNIISVNGVNNIEKYLEFYNSYYKEKPVHKENVKKRLKVLLDNDNAGREVYKKLNKKKYDFIDVELILLKNFSGNYSEDIDKNYDNYEIEDLIYPEIIIYLVNKILSKRSFDNIDIKTVNDKINEPSFSSKGIFNLIEYEKNSKNLKNGNMISFISSGKNTNQMKESMAEMFNIKGDKKIKNIIEKNRIKYPSVEEFLIDLFNF